LELISSFVASTGLMKLCRVGGVGIGGGAGTWINPPQSGQGPESGRVSGMESLAWQWGHGKASRLSGSWRTTSEDTVRDSRTSEKNAQSFAASTENHVCHEFPVL
jgi:hypothetical protein